MNLLKTYLLAIYLISSAVIADESVCYGTTSKGKLDRGVEVPRSGKNFITYSNIARLAGRTYVHSQVNSIIVKTYKSLEKEQPDKVFKYAETGFENGGKFKPHKTHRNGLSVDFMTPVTEESGKSVHLPTHPLNKFGYDIEFDIYGQTHCEENKVRSEEFFHQAMSQDKLYEKLITVEHDSKLEKMMNIYKKK